MRTPVSPESEFRKFVGEGDEETRLVYALAAAMAFKAAAEYIGEEKSVKDAQARLLVLAYAGFRLVDSYEKEMLRKEGDDDKARKGKGAGWIATGR